MTKVDAQVECQPFLYEFVVNKLFTTVSTKTHKFLINTFRFGFIQIILKKEKRK